MQHLLASSLKGIPVSSPTRNFILAPPSGAGGENDGDDANNDEGKGCDEQGKMEEDDKREPKERTDVFSSNYTSPSKSLQAIARSLAEEDEEAEHTKAKQRLSSTHTPPTREGGSSSSGGNWHSPMKSSFFFNQTSPSAIDGSASSRGNGEEDLLANKNMWRELYMSRFSGLDSYGQSGMTKLEELVDAALSSCENARKICPGNDEALGAALLTQKGTMYTGCSLESSSNPLLSVSAERTAILKAVSEGDSKFLALVIASDSNEAFPAPDGSSRQYLAEFGMFPVFLVNRDLKIQTTSTPELYPFQPSPSPPRRRKRPSSPRKEVRGHSPYKAAEDDALRMYR